MIHRTRGWTVGHGWNLGGWTSWCCRGWRPGNCHGGRLIVSKIQNGCLPNKKVRAFVGKTTLSQYFRVRAPPFPSIHHMHHQILRKAGNFHKYQIDNKKHEKQGKILCGENFIQHIAPACDNIMVWGSSGLKSCEALLQRVQDNDPKLSSMIILPMKTFGAPEVEQLAQILASGVNTNLRSISASGHQVPPEALSMLGKALAISENVQELSIGDESMGDEGLVALCQPMSTGQVKLLLEHVDFGFKSLSSTGTAMIGRTFGGRNGMKKLDIYRNPSIGDDGIVALMSQQQEMKQWIFPDLEFLDISECKVGSKGVEALTRHLLLSPDGASHNDQRPWS